MSELHSAEMSDVYSLVKILSICHRGFCKCFSSCHAATKSCAFSICCDDLRLSERCALKWLGFASEWSVQSREARTEQGEVRSTGTRINGTWAVFSEWTEWAVLRAKAEKKKRKSTKHSRWLIYRSSTECGRGILKCEMKYSSFLCVFDCGGGSGRRKVSRPVNAFSKSLIRLGSRAKCFPSQAAP